MPFNLNSVPAEGRTPELIKAHLDLYNKSQDICLVQNPDVEDFTFFYNRRFNPNPYVIPGKNKDIGFGPGRLEIRRYLAMIYVEKKGELMIKAISKADWDKKKENYRLEERGQMEERLALRTNNQELWKAITPKLFIGVVRRSTEEIGTGEFMEEKPIDPNLSNAEQVMEQLGLTDKELNLAHETHNEQITDEERRKADLLASIAG